MNGKKGPGAIMGMLLCLTVLGTVTVPAHADQLELNWLALPSGAGIMVMPYMAVTPGGTVYVTTSFADIALDWHQYLEKYNAAGNRVWQVAEDGKTLNVLVTDTSGNIYAGGTIYHSGETPTEGRLVKYDSDGNLLWEEILGEEIHVFVSAADAAGNVYGTVRSYDSLYNLAIFKYATDGNQIWTATYGNGEGLGVWPSVDLQGNVYASGLLHEDITIEKYDPDGQQLWIVTYDMPDGAGVCSPAIALGSAGNVYVSVIIGHEDTGVLDCHTIKYDPEGNELWTATYTETLTEVTPDAIETGGALLMVDASGNVYVAPKFSGLDRFLALKYDPEGNPLWVASHSTTHLDYTHAMVVDSFGNVYLTGVSARNDYYPVTTMKFDSEGNRAWTTDFGLPALSNFPTSMQLDNNGGIYIVGFAGGRPFEDDPHAVLGVLSFLIKYTESPSSWNTASIVEARGDGIGESVYAGTSGLLSWLFPLLIPFFSIFVLLRKIRKEPVREETLYP